MNEGHSSFLGLELIKQLVRDKGLSFKEAREVVASCTCFTTHTPVPAGNDVFPLTLIDKYFSNYWSNLEINRHEFLDLGLKVSDHNNFNMTVLALSVAGRKNGVSELHGAVSRNIFKNAWTSIPEDEVPIKHITNGIHTLTWMSPSIKDLMDKYVGAKWDEKMEDPDYMSKIDNIPDEELWSKHCQLKEKMIGYVRDKLRVQRKANGDPLEYIREVDNLLDPNALTIGFARRFATYKRANLIFRNLAKIQKILNNPKMPMQIVFAGKAHPADKPAHEVIRNINAIAFQEGFRGKVVLVENYNMTLARNLVQGVDIWLNNPRRPLEASGTSGQKVAINGILNFSILDGWWCEGYNGKNGWSIGENISYENEYYQDNADSESIYNTLEQEILPLFYDRNENNVPTQWVKMMKEAMKSLTYEYSTQRMVSDYFTNMYKPCMDRMYNIADNNYAFAKELSEWKQKTSKIWPNIQIISDKSNNNNLLSLSSTAGKDINVSVEVYLDCLTPDEVSVQLYYGKLNDHNNIESSNYIELLEYEKVGQGRYKYMSSIQINEGGEYGYTYRVLPKNTNLIDPFDSGFIKWIL
jgi:starch phosphorylase